MNQFSKQPKLTLHSHSSLYHFCGFIGLMADKAGQVLSIVFAFRLEAAIEEKFSKIMCQNIWDT